VSGAATIGVGVGVGVGVLLPLGLAPVAEAQPPRSAAVAAMERIWAVRLILDMKQT